MMKAIRLISKSIHSRSTKSKYLVTRTCLYDTYLWASRSSKKILKVKMGFTITQSPNAFLLELNCTYRAPSVLKWLLRVEISQPISLVKLKTNRCVVSFFKTKFFLPKIVPVTNLHKWRSIRLDLSSSPNNNFLAFVYHVLVNIGTGTKLIKDLL